MSVAPDVDVAMDPDQAETTRRKENVQQQLAADVQLRAALRVAR